jgi:molecular chaperone IbpA
LGSFVATIKGVKPAALALAKQTKDFTWLPSFASGLLGSFSTRLTRRKPMSNLDFPFQFATLGKDFDKFFVGFDDQFRHLQKLHDDVTKNIPNYPPYNIRKVDDTHYVIEMAVAGFGQTDIDIEIDGGKLVVKGNAKSDESVNGEFLFKGIAARDFTRTFALNDQVEVKDAELFNGMLKIALERLIPEEKKPKKVAVKSASSKQLLTE